MRIRIICLTLVVLVALTFGGGFAAAEEWPGQFLDAQGHWASESIARCRAHQLMSGYPGNLFTPDQSLTRAEALVVVGRGLGWDKQAGGMSTSGLKFPPDLWKNFRGYVALAVNKQLISKESVPSTRFNDPAGRLEMALWLGKALNLTGSGAALNFTDLGQVAGADRNLLAGVVGAGILKGLPGNLFGPDQPLTRAEMATILARLVDSGKISPSAGRYLTGKLAQFDQAQNKVLLQSASGSNSYNLNGSCLVFRAGAVSDPASLVKDEEVGITLNQSGQGVVVSLAGQSPQSQNSGIYSGRVGFFNNGFLMFQPTGGTTMALPVSPSAAVTIAGSQVPQSAITAGAEATITVSGGQVTAIGLTGGAAQSAPGDKGYVVNKYWDYFTVRLGYGVIKEIRPGSVIFTRGGVVSDYGAVRRGSYVELTKSGSAITGVNILDGGRKVFGEVERAESRSVTIKDEDGREDTYSLGNSVRVLDTNSRRVEVEDVERGQDVEISLDDSDIAQEVKISRDSGNDLDGVVEYLRTSGVKRITIRDNDGDSHSYYLADGVVVKEGSSTRGLLDVALDTRVELTLDSHDDVILIEVMGSSGAEGEVTYIRTSGTKRIEIRRSDGGEETYYLADGVTVREGASLRDLDDVEDGTRVKLTLDDDRRVTRIEITDQSIVEGEVTYIRTSGSNRIEIRDSRDDEREYYLDSDVRVSEGGSARDLDDVDRGMFVRLTLDRSDDVIRIDILGSSSAEGEVKYIQTAGNSKRIKIKDGDGHDETYSLAGGVTVREGGATRSLNYVLVGMKVRISLNEYDEVGRIEVIGAASVEGRVTDISLAGTKKIVLEDTDGREETYYLADFVDVEEDGENLDLNDIYEGMYVELTLENYDVTRIEIVSSTMVEGEVMEIRTSGSERIRIRKPSGQEESFYLDNNVYVREDGSSRDLDDIEEGMQVRLHLDEDLDVTRIEIIGVMSVRGEVTYIRTSGTEKIRIEKSNGQEVSYYLKGNVTVKENGVTRYLNDVTVGLDVELTLDEDDQVTHIDII